LLPPHGSRRRSVGAAGFGREDQCRGPRPSGAGEGAYLPNNRRPCTRISSNSA
jgi:hypothetical protein